MKSIIYTRPDGGLSICHPMISRDDPEDFSEEDALQRALQKDVPPDAVNPTIIDRDQIPQDRTFRDAWRHVGEEIRHDMDRCRDIHRDRMRSARLPRLAALDVEYQRAEEAGDMARKRDIAAEKQVLRDVTKLPELDSTKSPDDLKAVWPQDILGPAD
ncbi:hypothetical protein [Bradyrhizobium pachyrhizi]|uniref:hypothetical protein n=1 Tax=Bradyrhizobium pachyrhizi TaxID=280333 RepID=UPI003D36382E